MSKDFLDKFEEKIGLLLKNVPRGTFFTMYNYAQYLLEWNLKIALVASNETLENILNRHILDSLQLYHFIIPKNGYILDLGSGAGFPGMPLAIIGIEKILLTECNLKKVSFLRYIKAKLNVNVEIYTGDYSKINNLSVDYFLSRAVTSVLELVNSVFQLITEETVFLLHKSKKQLNEMDELAKYYYFELQIHQNLFNNEGVIFQISKLVKI